MTNYLYGILIAWCLLGILLFVTAPREWHDSAWLNFACGPVVWVILLLASGGDGSSE
jgi:hypothetical protein